MPRGKPPPRPVAEKFWERVEKTDGCWRWTGTHGPRGYGQLSHGKHLTLYVHRVAYELLVGPIPEGLTLDHLCRNPGCCNPEHLEPVTLQENIMRGGGACAQNARKTHCKWGHPLEGDNVIVRKDGRVCRECKRRSARLRMRRLRAAASEPSPST